MQLTNHTNELIRQARVDKNVRDKLVETNQGLVWSIVRRFTGRGVDAEDLFQIGCIGLIKAIDNFDLSFEVKFSTYAVPVISGEIKRFLRDDGMLKVSRIHKDNLVKSMRAAEELRKKYKQEPTIEEISKVCNISVEDIMLAYDANATVDSIDRTVDAGDGNEVSIIDRLEDKSNFREELINRITINQMLEELEPSEAQLIRCRYFDELTQVQTATYMGVTQVQVSRLEKRILLKLRRILV